MVTATSISKVATDQPTSKQAATFALAQKGRVRAMGGQHQQGGSDSNNLQAGRDMLVVQGLTYAETLSLFQRNFVELEGRAMEVARGRVEEMMTAFFAQLEEKNPAALESGADPDMQLSLFNAQRGYAASGEEDLQQTLIDLLIDRAGQSARGLESIVLNEAILAAPKLTEDQRQAVAACFLIRHTRWVGGLSLDLFYDYVREQIAPLGLGLPRTLAPYQHIEYVGAGSVSIGEVDFFRGLVGQSPGLITRGFTLDDIPETSRDLVREPGIFRACIRDESRLQLQAIDEQDVDRLTKQVSDQQATDLRQLFQMGHMTDGEIREEVLTRVPELSEFAETWAESALRKLSLTSVGVAIGHGYWRRVTGSNAPLFIFLK